MLAIPHNLEIACWLVSLLAFGLSLTNQILLNQIYSKQFNSNILEVVN